MRQLICWISELRFQCTATILFAIFTTGWAIAQPYGYSVNSRGNTEPELLDSLWRVNLSNGAVERIGPTRFPDMEGLAFTPDGTLYGASDQEKTLVTINTNSGFSEPVNNELFNMGVPLDPMDLGMTSTCEGNLLAVSAIEESLFTASRETGRLERIGELGSLGAPIKGIAAWGDELYGLGQGQVRNDANDLVTAAPNLYRIDRATATAQLIGPLGPQASPYANAGLAFDEQGTLWAVTDRRDNDEIDLPSEILRVDPETGNAEKVADADLVGFESLAVAAPGGCGAHGGTGSEIPIIPTNNRFGLALMALLLLAAALAAPALRQQR